MTTTHKFLIVVAVLVAAFFGLGAYQLNTPDGQARSQERDVIAACWQQQERKSFSPEAARFIAGACEKLEADFRAKWNREP